MGSHLSHDKEDKKDGGSGSGSGLSTPRAGSQRSSAGPRGSTAGVDPPKPDKAPQLSLVPVEKLAKLLAQRSQKEDGVNGITERSFVRYVFPAYPELARRFFLLALRSCRAKEHHIPVTAFRQHCEKLLAMLDDNVIVDTYVRMFSASSEEGTVTAEGFRALLLTSFRISMDHYPEGPQTCPEIERTLSAVVSGCFQTAETHSVGFVSRWLMDNCHRLLLPVHRYCVHVLSTRHRQLEGLPSPPEGGAGAGALPAGGGGGGGGGAGGAGLGLSTPVLDRNTDGSDSAKGRANLLPLSMAWLVAGAAPAVYSRPLSPPPPPSQCGAGAVGAAGALGAAGGAWLSRLVCALPSHWVALYDSNQHGLGANRFLHHTLSYRGPTLVVVSARSSDMVVVVGSTAEWRESHLYYGGADSFLLQLRPALHAVCRGHKLLYLNTSIRGYPKGLRAGPDMRKPILSINADFDHFDYDGAPYAIADIEVWGCGDSASREAQLDVKRWQVKEAERHRNVKLSAADWVEHPDRYLLELAGRPQYNT